MMIRGIASSPGAGAGRVYILHERNVPLGRTGPTSPGDGTSAGATHDRRSTESELERFHRGRSVAATYYESLVERVRRAVGEDEAEIFEGHLEILTGDDLAEAVEEAILSNGAIAERAAVDFAEETAREFEALDSEYFQQRAGDIRDIGRRLAEAIYYGSITDPGTLPEESIVVAEELTPSSTARLDTNHVAAIATEKGGKTSHAAILARSLNIPCVTGVSGLLEAVRSGQTIIVDGDAGTVDTDASEEKVTAARSRAAEGRDIAAHRRNWALEHPARLADGSAVHLAANVSGADEATQAAAVGAAGSGLLRSEFLFMRYTDYPSVDQQAAEYARVCEALAPHPVVVRLLDCGADKPLPYAQQPKEDNPFLGERGIRFLMARESQLVNQVSAIARVAEKGHNIKAMIPMVISQREIDVVRNLVADAKLPVGIMVETPSSVMTIASLAERVDFVSIGTNDLVQYLLAVDRGNARVATLYEDLHPAVIAAIDRVVQACHERDVHVGVCGDMASHPHTALALLALGVDELSASTAAIPEIKAALGGVSSDALASLRTSLLDSTSSAAATDAARALVPADIAPWRSA